MGPPPTALADRVCPERLGDLNLCPAPQVPPTLQYLSGAPPPPSADGRTKGEPQSVRQPCGTGRQPPHPNPPKDSIAGTWVSVRVGPAHSSWLRVSEQHWENVLGNSVVDSMFLFRQDWEWEPLLVSVWKKY